MTKILKFYAPWCAPCTALGKVISESDVIIDIEEINIDDEPEKAAEYGVRSIPTLVLIKDGSATKRKTGMMSKEEFEEFAQ